MLARRGEVVLALLLYVALPESAFFGRMLNHEVLVLPFAMLLVRGYWESVHGGWRRSRWTAAIGVGAVGAAVSGWAGFFAIGACALHVGWETFMRRNPRATAPVVLLVAAGAVLFAGTVMLLLSAPGGDVPTCARCSPRVRDGVRTNDTVSGSAGSSSCTGDTSA